MSHLFLYPFHSAQYLGGSNSLTILWLMVESLSEDFERKMTIGITFYFGHCVSLNFWKVDAKMELKVQEIS